MKKESKIKSNFNQLMQWFKEKLFACSNELTYNCLKIIFG